MAEKQKDLNKRSKINTSVSMDLLESYRKSLYAVKNFLDNASNNIADLDIETQIKVSKAISDLGKDLGKNIESLDKLEDKVKREERESVSRRGNSETSLFEE
jgi:hypothetical protein